METYHTTTLPTRYYRGVVHSALRAPDLHQGGTTVPCAVLPLGAGRVGYVSGRGSFYSPIPVQFAPSPRPLLSQATPQAPEARRRAAGFRPAPSFSSGGILPHPLLVPWMPVLLLFFSLLVLLLESRFWGYTRCIPRFSC